MAKPFIIPITQQKSHAQLLIEQAENSPLFGMCYHCKNQDLTEIMFASESHSLTSNWRIMVCVPQCHFDVWDVNKIEELQQHPELVNNCELFRGNMK